MMRSHSLARLLPAAALALTILPSTPTRADEIDDIVMNDMQARHIPGLALAVVQNGAVVKTSAYGLADVDKNTAVYPDTMFEIGPLTRQITATAVMPLVEKGKVGLDDKISKYIDNTPDAWADVTVRHLLTQTSGIKDCDEVTPVAERMKKGLTVDQTLALIWKLPLDFTAGTQWESSNTNYLLLGKIIEKASGTVYGEYISKNILQPTDMKSTHLANPKAAFPGLALGYTLGDSGAPKLSMAATASSEWSAGSLIVSAGDMGKWDAALDGGKLVSADSVDEMLKPTKPNGDGGIECAMGVTFRHPQGHNIAENGGATMGFMSHYLRDIDDHLEIIVLTNDATVDPMPLSHRILEFYVPTIAPDPMAEKEQTVDDYCKGILQKLVDGKLDESQFTPTLWASLKDQHLDAVGKHLATLGGLTTFDQTDKDFTPEGQPTYTYRCIFGDTAYILTVGPSADSKIGTFKFAIDPFDAE
jgi:CubicO group peptidase (beta-lactamase class C family)